MDMIMETPRSYLRKIWLGDYSAMCLMLQDIDVMYAWEHAFSDAEVAKWINENIERYNRDGYSYWAVIEKSALTFAVPRDEASLRDSAVWRFLI